MTPAGPGRVVSRLLLVAVLALVVLPVGSGTASAHGGGGIGPEAHMPRIVAVDPPVPGLTVAVIDAGSRLRIDNRTGAEIEVVPPANALRSTEPVIAHDTTARWTDNRVTSAAAGTAPAEGRRAWAVPLRVGDREVTIHGEQVWPAPPAAGPWWAGTALAAGAAAIIGTLAAGRRRMAPVLAATTLLVAGAHVVHVLGSALVVDGQPYLRVALGAAGVAMGAWVLALAGAVLTLRHHAYGPLLCASAGAVLALFTAFDAVGFSTAVLPFGWPADLDRATTVLTFGGGAGLFLAAFAMLNRFDRERPAQAPATP